MARTDVINTFQLDFAVEIGRAPFIVNSASHIKSIGHNEDKDTDIKCGRVSFGCTLQVAP